MKKNDKKSYLLNYSIIFLLAIIFNIFYQYLYGSVIYCDGVINSSETFEPFCSSEAPNDYSQDRDCDISNANCSTGFTKYQDIARRKFFWYACIKSKGTYNSYKDYKLS